MCSGCEEDAQWPEVFAGEGDAYDLQAQIKALFSAPVDWNDDVTCLMWDCPKWILRFYRSRAGALALGACQGLDVPE